MIYFYYLELIIFEIFFFEEGFFVIFLMRLLEFFVNVLYYKYVWGLEYCLLYLIRVFVFFVIFMVINELI